MDEYEEIFRVVHTLHRLRDLRSDRNRLMFDSETSNRRGGGGLRGFVAVR